jgi:uncharacterized protein (DUF983 family)
MHDYILNEVYLKNQYVKVQKQESRKCRFWSVHKTRSFDLKPEIDCTNCSVVVVVVVDYDDDGDDDVVVISVAAVVVIIAVVVEVVVEVVVNVEVVVEVVVNVEVVVVEVVAVEVLLLKLLLMTLLLLLKGEKSPFNGCYTLKKGLPTYVLLMCKTSRPSYCCNCVV